MPPLDESLILRAMLRRRTGELAAAIALLRDTIYPTATKEQREAIVALLARIDAK